MVRLGETPAECSTCSTRVPISETNSFAFLHQAVRTTNAAFVADSALKPTSIYTVREVEDRVRVLTHLSEAVPERYLADAPELERFL
ncbi:MAG: hypothetical protein ACM3ZF_12015 [Mycobacterium leprae]